MHALHEWWKHQITEKFEANWFFGMFEIRHIYIEKLN